MSYNSYFSGHSWQNYQELENNVLECLTYVALDDANIKVWSNRLGEVLIRIGSAIDSFLFNIRKSNVFDNEQGIQELRLKGQPDIADYRKFFEKYYKLSEVTIDVKPNGVLYKSISPFKEFQDNQSPNWWLAYNKVKHEWYDSLQQYGTLENVIKAIGGLFILNVLHKDCQNWLIEKEIITSYLGKNDLKRQLKESKIGIPAVLECWAISRLFEHKFRW